MQPKNTTVSRNFDGRGGRTTADLSKIQDFWDFRHMVANHDGFVPELTMVKSTENLKIPQILENAGKCAQNDTFLVLLVNFWSFRRAAGEFCSHFYKKIFVAGTFQKPRCFGDQSILFLQNVRR